MILGDDNDGFVCPDDVPSFGNEAYIHSLAPRSMRVELNPIARVIEQGVRVLGHQR
jgi:hypothetical protein